MLRRLVVLGFVCAALQPALAAGHAKHLAAASSVARGHSRADAGVPRDAKGRIARSAGAKHEFQRSTGFAHGRPGYVIDHVVPLARGGCDCPANMQWQTISDAKAKDRIELK